jgi:hypothetical protein
MKLCTVRFVHSIVASSRTSPADPSFLACPAPAVLSAEDASLIVAEFRLNPIIDNERGFDIYPEPIPADNSHLPLRPPMCVRSPPGCRSPS